MTEEKFSVLRDIVIEMIQSKEERKKGRKEMNRASGNIWTKSKGLLHTGNWSPKRRGKRIQNRKNIFK